MPTYFVKSYERPDGTEKLSASVAVRLLAVGSNFRLGAPTPLASSVDATVPAVASVWVAKFTSMESCPGFCGVPARLHQSPRAVAVDRVGDRCRAAPMRHHRHVDGAHAWVGAVGDNVVDQFGLPPVGRRPRQRCPQKPAAQVQRLVVVRDLAGGRRRRVRLGSRRQRERRPGRDRGVDRPAALDGRVGTVQAGHERAVVPGRVTGASPSSRRSTGSPFRRRGRAARGIRSPRRRVGWRCSRTRSCSGSSRRRRDRGRGCRQRHSPEEPLSPRSRQGRLPTPSVSPTRVRLACILPRAA